MALNDLKFSENDFTNQGITDLPTKVSQQAAFLKAKFDNIAKNLIALGRFNSLIDRLVGITDGGSGADNIGATPLTGGTANTVQSALEELKAAQPDLAEFKFNGSQACASGVATGLAITAITPTTWAGMSSGYNIQLTPGKYLVTAQLLSDGITYGGFYFSASLNGTGVKTDHISSMVAQTRKLIFLLTVASTSQLAFTVTQSGGASIYVNGNDNAGYSYIQIAKI